LDLRVLLTLLQDNLKKILIITYYWPPSGGAGVQRILKFCKHLPLLGYKPYVVTVDEKVASYPAIDNTFEKDIPDEVEVARTDTFEPFNIYSKLIGRKSIPTGFSNESDPGFMQKITRFIRGNFFIPDARRGWVKYAIREAEKIIEREKINTVICTSPPHSVQLCGLYLKKKYGIKWIADLRDPWTDIYYYDEFFHMPFAKVADSILERKILENSDAIVTVSNDLKRLFLSKSKKISASKLHVIPNGFDEDDFAGIEGNPGKDFIISYTGTLADSYDPEIFLYGLRSAIEKTKGIRIILHLIGNPSESVMKKAEEMSIADNVKFTPTVTHEKSVQMLMDSDALLLLIPNVKNDKGILTGKLFEYLASRKPVIAVGPVDGDAAMILKECNAGKMFSRNEEDKIADYISELAQRKLNNEDVSNDDESFKKYSRRAQAEELSKIIQELN
jgi:glycosyltransferase involved in cell wall biosynthesis